jgi:phosphohistidine phosphatase
MRQLILLRHAKSSWADSGLDDFDRALADRGKRDAPRMAARLAARGAVPQVLLASPAKRALHTAEIVARGLGLDPEQVRTDEALYLASPRTMLRVIGEQDDGCARLLVVAHNPGLTELVNELLPDLGLDNLPTAGVVGIDSPAKRWADFARGRGRLAFYDFPKNPQPVSG